MNLALTLLAGNIYCGLSTNYLYTFMLFSSAASLTHVDVIFDLIGQTLLCCSNINVTSSLCFVSPQRAKRCTRDRCCRSRPSPWRSACWEACAWPSTAATSEADKHTQQHSHRYTLLVFVYVTQVVLFSMTPLRFYTI